MLRRFLHTYTGVVITAVVVCLLVGGGVALGVQFFQDDTPGTVTVESVGDISISPASLSFGSVNRDEVVDVPFTIINGSDGPVFIETSSNITGSLISNGHSALLCSVNSTSITGVLAETANITGLVYFTIDHGALAGEQEFIFTITGSTPPE